MVTNNSYIVQLESGGTYYRDLIGLDSSNIIQIGNIYVNTKITKSYFLSYCISKTLDMSNSYLLCRITTVFICDIL